MFQFSGVQAFLFPWLIKVDQNLLLVHARPAFLCFMRYGSLLVGDFAKVMQSVCSVLRCYLYTDLLWLLFLFIWKMQGITNDLTVKKEKKKLSMCENCQGELWQLTESVSWLGEGIAGVWDNVLLSFLGPLQFLIEHLLHGGALWGRIVAGFCKVCALFSNQAVNQYIWQGT